MIRINKIISVFLISILGICVFAACSGGDAATIGSKEDPDKVAKAFETAKIINENSNIDIELLGIPGVESGAGASEGEGEMSPPASYLGDVTAYAFPYPDDSDTIYWTQVYVETEKNDLLGIHIGDDIADINEVLEQYGFALEETTDHVYTSKDADHEDTYRNGDVYFYLYMKGDSLVFMLVSVHE